MTNAINFNMAGVNSDTELLTEHFGYPPVSLIDEIINSINILADKALTSVETGLLNAPPTSIGFGQPPASSTANSKSKRKRKQPSPPPPTDDADLSPEQIADLAHAEIAAGTHQLETLLCTSIDRNFDKFELYVMKNILCVRPEDRDWIRLGHYEGLNFDNLPAASAKEDGDDDDDKMDVDEAAGDPGAPPTVASVNRLRRRLQASQRLNALLAAEKARNDALLGELRAVAGRARAPAVVKDEPEATGEAKQQPPPPPPPLAFLHDRGDLTQADAATPLTTTTAFALSQMEAVRALSASLSNIMPYLGGRGGAGEDGGGRKTWRKERVEYVEGAARRHLESVRGLELGRDGEVRDGEWQGEGGRVAAAEVGALEGVVEMLGKEGEEEDKGDGDGNGDGVE